MELEEQDRTVRIANGAGFLGDWLDAPRRLIESCEVHYLTLEYLAELTLSILARSREKDPQAGFAVDFLEVLESLVPPLRTQPGLKIVTNAGGMNPEACVQRCSRLLAAAGMGDELVGTVTGDDLLPRLDELRELGCSLANLDTHQPLEELGRGVISANAYLGARPIHDALAQGARFVVTGRVADASLTVGPVMYEFGWAWDDWDKLAVASVAGHLIECGAQVTGGYSTRWESCSLADVGYPIAEIARDAEVVITKPRSTGGRVDRQTVCEQLVYEIGDPTRYLTPDVEVDFTTVAVREAGADRVRVSGATGRPAPDRLKVSLAYRDGFMASSQLLVYGPDCVRKAEACAEVVFRRLEQSGFRFHRRNVELLGRGDGLPYRDGLSANSQPPEVVLRLAVHDPRREAVERFVKETAPLITSGPAGLAGYAAGRSPVRPVYAFWPTSIPREFVEPRVEVRPARQWLST